jgi:hypothetical protein
MSYYQRKAHRRQCMVIMLAATSAFFVLTTGVAAFAMAAPQSIGCAVLATLCAFAAANEREQVRILRQKGDISDAAALRREREAFRASLGR